MSEMDFNTFVRAEGLDNIAETVEDDVSVQEVVVKVNGCDYLKCDEPKCPSGPYQNCGLRNQMVREDRV